MYESLQKLNFKFVIVTGKLFHDFVI